MLRKRKIRQHDWHQAKFPVCIEFDTLEKKLKCDWVLDGATLVWSKQKLFDLVKIETLVLELDSHKSHVFERQKIGGNIVTPSW